MFHFLYLFCLSSLTTGVHTLPVHSLNSVILLLCAMDVPHVVVFMLDCGCVNKTASREEVLCQFRRDGTSMSTRRNYCFLPSCLMISLQACCEGNDIFLAACTSSKINQFKITQGKFVWWKLGAVTKFLPWFDSETQILKAFRILQLVNVSTLSSQLRKPHIFLRYIMTYSY